MSMGHDDDGRPLSVSSPAKLLVFFLPLVGAPLSQRSDGVPITYHGFVLDVGRRALGRPHGFAAFPPQFTLSISLATSKSVFPGSTKFRKDSTFVRAYRRWVVLALMVHWMLTRS